MANQNFVTTVGAFTPDNYYEGPASFMPGGGAFLASALFQVLADVAADQYIVQNRNVGNNQGWAILARPSAPGIELLVQVGNAVGMNETSLGNYQFGVLTLMHIAAQPNAVDIYLQGTLVTTIAITGSASALAPRIGTDQGGADPAGGAAVVGVGYTPNAPPFAPALAALHYQNCRATFDFAQILQAPAGSPGSDFTTRYTARTGLAPGAAQATPNDAPLGPASWAPIVGAQALTRASDGFRPAVTTLTNPPWLALDV